jgi:hypothetical protein
VAGDGPPHRGGAGLWVAVLVPGALAAAALPLSALGAPPPQNGLFLVPRQDTLTRALYLRGGAAVGPANFPLGWYWTGVLAVSVLATAVWCRRRDRVAGRPGRLRGYLAAGAVLVVVTAALPLLGWRTSAVSLGDTAAWLGALWQQGTFALLAIAVTLGILARARRRRGLAVVAVVCAAATLLAGWVEAQPTVAPLYYPKADPAVLLPAAMLLVAAAISLLTAAVRRLLPANRRAPVA